MKTILKKISKLGSVPARFGLILAAILLLDGANLLASPTLTTLGGGNPNISPKYLGYKNGSTLTNALFHTPYGIALDETYDLLYVADRDNNAVRQLDLYLGETSTFVATNLTSHPVGVAVDAEGNVYVVNRGSTNNFSTNGSVLTFDTYGDLIATNATQLTNAAGIAIDSSGDIYVTVRSNTLMQITASGAKKTIATITNAGTYLQGIIVKESGLIAAVDSGRHGVYLIDPNTGIVTTNAGFNGAGDGTGNANHGILATNAQFNQPTCVAEAGDGSLIITDTGNNRVKVINAAGVVTNLYGVSSNYWSGTYPGWTDGTVVVPDRISPNVQSRLPVGIAFASDGSVYTTEDYYHLIRKVTGAGLPLPPSPPPQVPTPQIGYVDFPATSTPIPYTSVFHAGSSFVFNNDVPIVILGTNGSSIYYTYGTTPASGDIAVPTSSSASASLGYQDGVNSNTVALYAVAGITPYLANLTIRAIGEKSDGSPNSAIAETKFQFITANPTVNGNNAAQFTVSNITSGALMYYTTDGTDIPNTGGGIGPVTNGSTISLTVTSNLTFKIRAFRANYQPSAEIVNVFSVSNFIQNNISFGFASGEASSDFIASPGQTFYAPVTLTTLPNTVIYSLQFNLTVTNLGVHPVAPGAFSFQSMLEQPGKSTNTSQTVYYPIPPLMYAAYNTNVPASQLVTNSSGQVFVNLETTNTAINLLAVGWIEHYGNTNLYNTLGQDLIQYSQAHDDMFPNAQQPNGVIVGGYGFQVPTNATAGEQYLIQIGRPTATADGFGVPGSSVAINTPYNGSLTNGAINAIKYVTAGQRRYLVGNAYPFRWFNAGDFGNTNLQNADVEQVFESAAYQFNTPPTNTDFYDCMDSSGSYGAYDSGHGYYTNAGALTANQLMSMYGNINPANFSTNMFGDGVLDVSDVYVTYIRSIDPTLAWVQRFWTNGVRAAQFTGNIFNPNVVAKNSQIVSKAASTGNTVQPQVNFSAGSVQGTAGQTVQVPITAQIFGAYPLRVLMLNLSVVPLDGSPALTTAVSFTPNAALGTPAMTDSIGAGNYTAAWLNNAVAGLTNAATIGTLTVTIPAGATGLSAYAIHFDHASGSPNGFVSFPKQTLTGLLTLSARTNSSYGDGIPDSWRLLWFGTTNNLLSVSNACPTGDGLSNYKKYVAGVDPTVANDFPSVNAKSPVPAGSTTAIHWPTVASKLYVIERSPSLFSGTWTAISTNTGTGLDMEFDDNAKGNAQFYRVRILP